MKINGIVEQLVLQLKFGIRKKLISNLAWFLFCVKERKKIGMHPNIYPTLPYIHLLQH